MPSFSTRRCVELSSFEYLQTQLNANWTGVTTIKTFTQAYDTSVNPPIVCVRLDDTTETHKEIGSTTLLETYTLLIDIFARSHGQRLDLASFIIDQLKAGWQYKIFSHVSGNPEQLQSTASGRVSVQTFLQDGPVNFGENVDVKDKYRHVIAVAVRVNP